MLAGDRLYISGSPEMLADVKMPADPEEQVPKRFVMVGTEEQETRVGGEPERRPAEPVKRLVHVRRRSSMTAPIFATMPAIFLDIWLLDTV